MIEVQFNTSVPLDENLVERKARLDLINNLAPRGTEIILQTVRYEGPHGETVEELAAIGQAQVQDMNGLSQYKEVLHTVALALGEEAIAVYVIPDDGNPAFGFMAGPNPGSKWVFDLEFFNLFPED